MFIVSFAYVYLNIPVNIHNQQDVQARSLPVYFDGGTSIFACDEIRMYSFERQHHVWSKCLYRHILRYTYFSRVLQTNCFLLLNLNTASVEQLVSSAPRRCAVHLFFPINFEIHCRRVP